MSEPSELAGVKRGAAILATCIVQVINESDPTFKGRLLDKLVKAYNELKNSSEEAVIDELEIVAWTRELLTGWSPDRGQGRAFME